MNLWKPTPAEFNSSEKGAKPMRVTMHEFVWPAWTLRDGVYDFDMPLGAEILHVDVTETGQLAVYARIQPDEPRGELRRLYVIPNHADTCPTERYIGSVKTNDHRLWHIFDGGKP